MGERESKRSTNSPETSPAAYIEEVQNQLRKLERRDWWLWSGAVVVMLVLTVAVVSMSFPSLLKVEDPVFQYTLQKNLRGLIALVLLFNAYSIYQQFSIKKVRRQFSDQMRHMETLHRLATTDPLTGLSNRRTAEQRLAAETARSWRYGHPLTLVAFDLNNFKQINDNYGHPAGDQVLLEFARRLTNAVRLSDEAVRMGGDEFLVILPECRIEQVPALMARLRPMEVKFQGKVIPVNFSAGSVAYENGESPEDFLERVDRTLYADKRAGKSHQEKQPALT